MWGSAIEFLLARHWRRRVVYNGAAPASMTPHQMVDPKSKPPHTPMMQQYGCIIIITRKTLHLPLFLRCKKVSLPYNFRQIDFKFIRSGLRR